MYVSEWWDFPHRDREDDATEIRFYKSVCEQRGSSNLNLDRITFINKEKEIGNFARENGVRASWVSWKNIEGSREVAIAYLTKFSEQRVGSGWKTFLRTTNVEKLWRVMISHVLKGYRL